MCRIYCIVFLLSLSVSFAQNNSGLTPYQNPDKQVGYKDQNQQIIIEARFEEGLPFSGSYACVKKEGLWGLINTKGKWMIPAIYENIGLSNGKGAFPAVAGEVTGYQQKGKWGLITIKNKPVTPPMYDLLEYATSGSVKAGKLTMLPQSDTLFGLLDTKGKEMIPLQYHTLASTQQSGVWLAGNNKVYHESGIVKEYGLVSADNRILLPVGYKQITAKQPDIFEVTPFQTYKILNLKGDTLEKFTTDSLYSIATNVYAFIIDGKTGIIPAGDSAWKAWMDKVIPQQYGFSVIKTKGKYGLFAYDTATFRDFLPASYDSVMVEPSGIIRAGIKKADTWDWQLTGKNAKGEQKLIGHSYHFIDQIQPEGLTRVMKNNLYGFINQAGEEVIPLQFDSVSNFTDSLCVAVDKGKSGILKKDGTWYFKPDTEAYLMNSYGYFLRKQKGIWEVLDIEGKKIHSSNLSLSFMPDGSIEIAQKGKVGRLNSSGEPCIPPIYDSISVMSSDNAFWAYAGKHIFLYKSNGEQLIKQGGLIEKLTYMPNDFSPVKMGSRYGFVDGLGRLRISNRYDGASPFSEGLAAVKFIGKWGYVNKQDKIIVQPYYDEVSPFRNGFAIVRKGKKYGLINSTGKEITDFIYDHIIPDASGVFITVNGNKQGLLGKTGQQVIYVKYDKLFPQPDGNIIAQLQGKSGLINAKGIIVFPLVYASVSKNPFSETYLFCASDKKFELNLLKLMPLGKN